MDSRKPRSWPSFGTEPRERAHEATRRLEDITRLISDWVWEADSELRIAYVSERIFERLGLLPVEVIGSHLLSIGQFVDAHDEPREIDLRKPFRDAAFVARDRDGREKHFTVAAMPRFDPESGAFLGVHGIAKDITDLRAAERTSDRLAGAIELLAEYFAIYDADDRLVIANERFREVNAAIIDCTRPGVPFEDLLRAGVAKGQYPDAIGREEQWVAEQLAMHRDPGGTFEIARQNGRWMMLNERRLSDGGTAVMGIDITERRRAEEAARASETRHREFAADVAHELRTPLAVMSTHLERMEQTEKVEGLREEVGSMTRLVAQLLAFTRLDTLVVGSDDKADLHELAIRVAGQLAPLAVRERRMIEVTGAERAVAVSGSDAVLDVALRNLVENALKYSARDTTVTIEVDAEAPALHVRDRGRGVDPEHREAIFQRFQRADRRGGGAGLGLAIVKRIADAHGAEIRVSDNPAGGAVFSLVFPATG
jgi:PAS domain S-box-containing protein